MLNLTEISSFRRFLSCFRITELSSLHTLNETISTVLISLYSKTETFLKFVKSPPHPFVVGDDRTPLHYAAASRHFQCLETLVSCGTCINATDQWGRSAVHYAAASDLDRRYATFTLEEA